MSKYRVVLTGATGGIGQALAKALAPHAQSMILLGRQAQALEKLAGELSGSCQVAIVCGDLLSQQTHQQLQAKVTDLGGVNLLIHNAGVSDFDAFENQDPAIIKQLLDVNLLTPLLLTQALLPSLKRESGAQIINIGSTFAYIGFPGFAAYCASKFGLRGFTQALRRELSGTGIVVRIFSPRATQTDINDQRVVAMNQALKTAVDTPAAVAQAFMQFLPKTTFEARMGFAENFFAILNQLLPGIPDGAIAGQVKTIRQFFRKKDAS
ncbi:MAG: SDR family oxidoreductase [Burkholderiaceae bacterium]|jgi:short-subunit dehydrogenase|nr:SDR family oxidoreductase [Burkholderiaceae bacterium]